SSLSYGQRSMETWREAYAIDLCRATESFPSCRSSAASSGCLGSRQNTARLFDDRCIHELAVDFHGTARRCRGKHAVCPFTLGSGRQETAVDALDLGRVYAQFSAKA